jgi:dihydrofolate reductase
MSRVQYYCAAALDGYIADSDDRIDWLTGYQGTYEGKDGDPGPMSEGGSYEAFYEGVGALVSGSVTYEFILEHMKGGGTWPYAGKPCWVLSSRDLPTPESEGADVRIVRGEVGELFGQMTGSAGDRNLWVVGGGNVASQFADAGLLNELHLTVVPVVLGEGKPLFDRGLREPLQLTGTRAFGNGMVELRYEVAREG